MAKIFLGFYNGAYDAENPDTMPCFYESFISGLRELGNEVIFCSHANFDYNFTEPATESFIKELKEFNPDLIILFNNCFYDLSKDFDCPIVVYEVDSLLYYSNKERLKQNPDRYKFIVSQSASIKVIKEGLGVKEENICHIPFFTAIKAENIPQTTNISFIGSKINDTGKKSVYNALMMTSPSELEICQFKLVEAFIKQNPFFTKEELINLLSIKSPKVANSINVDNFIWIISGTRRIQTLSQIADLGLDLYGPKNWATDLLYEPELTLSYKDKRVYSIKHNQDIYNSSKLCININHLQATTGFSWRVCDIMASNGCLVSEYKPDLEKLFPDVPIPTFTNRYEAREQCVKLLNNENMRKDIVAQCQEAVDKSYRFTDASKIMEEFLGINLNNPVLK